MSRIKGIIDAVVSAGLLGAGATQSDPSNCPTGQ